MRHPPVPDVFAELEQEVADPTNQTPTVLYVRSMQSMAAEVSLGRVSATVNGFGILKRVRVAPEMVSDLPRLGRLVRRAVNLARNEADRRRPPPPSPDPDDEFEPPWPPTPAQFGGAVEAADREPWRRPHDLSLRPPGGDRADVRLSHRLRDQKRHPIPVPHPVAGQPPLLLGTGGRRLPAAEMGGGGESHLRAGAAGAVA